MSDTSSTEPLRWQVPDDVLGIAARLRAAGQRCWVVAGAVRDALRGEVATDWDMAVTGTPETLLGLFDAGETTLRDGRLGTVHLDGHLDGDFDGGDASASTIAITCLRTERGYSDRRHPDEVEFVDDPAVDARRRDFTVNALYVPLEDGGPGALLDPTGGIADLHSSTLRVIGEPLARLREDPLRLLRAVRFAARIGLQPEPATLTAIVAAAPEVRVLASERVFDELTDAFTGPGRGRALRLLHDWGIAAFVLPEVPPMDAVPQPPEFHPEGDVLTHVCMVLDAVVPNDPVQAWAAVLHDVGKPATFERAADRIRFSGHDVLSAAMADAALRRLHVPSDFRETVVEVCRDHIRFASLPEMRPRRRERWLRSPRFRAHLEFHRADCLGSHGKLDIYEQARDLLEGLPPLPRPPLCTGKDVLALGIPPGPRVGEILRRVEAELDELDDPDRATALAVLRRVSSSPTAGGGDRPM